MKLKKLIKKLAKLPKQPKPLSLKYGKSYSKMIEEIYNHLKPIDENAPKTMFDATAFLSKFKRTNVVTYWDEMSINGITGETFTNGENN